MIELFEVDILFFCSPVAFTLVNETSMRTFFYVFQAAQLAADGCGVLLIISRPEKRRKEGSLTSWDSYVPRGRKEMEITRRDKILHWFNKFGESSNKINVVDCQLPIAETGLGGCSPSTPAQGG